jgi:hypothetical protein
MNFGASWLLAAHSRLGGYKFCQLGKFSAGLAKQATLLVDI